MIARLRHQLAGLRLRLASLLASRHPLELPLALATCLLGTALLLALAIGAPRIALIVTILSVVILVAVLRDLILGDR